ncbi:MAG TPA: MATE family efflux transporter [Bryobacteraceae bacterium]|nr:MATE family efflux transporter [Bryobacteraceae bacterium]
MPLTGCAAPAQADVANALGTGRIGKLLLEYSFPAIVGTSVASLYNIIDRVFIGHGVGPMAISGLALTLPMMNLAAAFGALVGAGAAALVSIRLGEGKRREAQSILGNTVFLNLVLSTTFSVVCLLFLDRILFAMGASRETLPYARQFMQVILAGNVFTHLYLGLNHLMRASGYPRKAMVTTLLTVGVNLALAPLFIFVFEWGIRGAAFATVCAQVAGTVRSVLHFARRDSLVRFYPGCLKPDLGIVLGIFSVGMSSFAMLFCASFVAVTYNVRLARYGGDYAIGAFGIVNALASLSAMIAAGVNMGMQPIAGYNFGARRFERVASVFRLAVIAATGITTLGFVLGELFPRAVARAFTVDARLIEQAVMGMRLTFAVFPMVGFQMVTSSFFQAIGKAQLSILLSLSRQALLLIPCLIVLPWYFGLPGVWLSGPVSDFTSSMVALAILKTQFRKSLAG